MFAKFLKKNVHLEFLDNKHKCMKVIDALGQICSYIAMCHLLKGFLQKFQILSSNIVAY
jgi:hypothetical protein